MPFCKVFDVSEMQTLVKVRAWHKLFLLGDGVPFDVNLLDLRSLGLVHEKRRKLD